MKKLILVICLGLFACASTYPIRDFEVKLWKPNVDLQEAQHLNDDTGTVQTIKFDDKRLEELIMISPEDYVKERKYQELLIKSCLQWR